VYLALSSALCFLSSAILPVIQESLTKADELFEDWLDGEYCISELISKGEIDAKLDKIIPAELKRC